MHLQKTSGTNLRLLNTGRSTSEQSIKNTSAKTSSAQPAKSVTSGAVTRSVSSLISAAGLPSDKLSASIVSFARFFSLALKPELLADIRRRVFAPQADTQAELIKREGNGLQRVAGNASGAEIATKNRETFSLAATAAESKGTELSTKGLETYAEAVDPEWQKRNDSDEQKRGRRDKNQNEQEKENPLLKTGSVTASSLKELALESSEKDPLLFLLNRMPGKNGQRWIVLPFSFFEKNIEYKVSLRIFLETKYCEAGQYASNHAACMALDISANNEQAEKGSGGQTANRRPERRWLFSLESANEKPIRLSVYLSREIPQKDYSRYSDELSKILKIPPERVFVKAMTESFPFELERGEEMLCATDEEA